MEIEDFRKRPSEPVTRGDLADIYEALLEAIHDSQTHILTAFYGFSNTLNARHKSQAATNHGFEDRLSAIENRLLEVEQRLNQQ